MKRCVNCGVEVVATYPDTWFHRSRMHDSDQQSLIEYCVNTHEADRDRVLFTRLWAEEKRINADLVATPYSDAQQVLRNAIEEATR